MGRIVRNDYARLMSYVTKTDGCWVFRTRWKRGTIWFRGRLDMPHRMSYILHTGEIPDGIEVCHSCDNPVCINPDHLFLGTHDDNMKDAVSKLRIKWGENHGMAILSENSVREIIRRGKRGQSSKGLAAEFGVSEVTIRRIKNGRGWKHLREKIHEETRNKGGSLLLGQGQQQAGDRESGHD